MIVFRSRMSSLQSLFRQKRQGDWFVPLAEINLGHDEKLDFERNETTGAYQLYGHCRFLGVNYGEPKQLAAADEYGAKIEALEWVESTLRMLSDAVLRSVESLQDEQLQEQLRERLTYTPVPGPGLPTVQLGDAFKIS